MEKMNQLQGLFFNLNPESNGSKGSKMIKSDKEEQVNMDIINSIVDPVYFEPEVETGNCEYKLLLKPSDFRFQHLLTQMNWRVKEGKGDARYRIGVCDDGLVCGLTKKQADLTLKTIERLAKKLNCTSRIVNEIIVKIKDNGKIEERIAYELIIEEMNKRDTLPEFKIALLGDTNAGKSTIVSVLTQSILDDSNGRARLSLGFRHKHELISGHTSSISREIYGYDHSNDILNYSGKINLDDCNQIKHDLLDDDLLNNSKYLVSLLDSGGSKKQLSTTIYGLNQCNFSFLVIDSNTKDLIGTVKDHLNILLTLNLPFLIIINKVDQVNQIECMKLIQKLSDHLENKTLKMIENDEDMESYFNEQKLDLLNSNDEINSVPLIKCSCVTGQSIGLIYRFVNQFIVKTPNVFDGTLKYNGIRRTDPLEFLIQDVFHQNDDTCVLGGLLSNGQINKNDLVLIGPMSNDRFIECKILSIERYKSSLNSLKETESGSLEIEFMDKENTNVEGVESSRLKNRIKVRKGMMIMSKSTDVSAIKVDRQFRVRLKLRYLLKNSIKKGFQAKIFIDNIKQTVCVVEIEGYDEIASSGEYSVVLRFIKKSEVIRIGSKFFLWQEDKFMATGSVIDYN